MYGQAGERRNLATALEYSRRHICHRYRLWNNYLKVLQPGFSSGGIRRGYTGTAYASDVRYVLSNSVFTKVPGTFVHF